MSEVTELYLLDGRTTEKGGDTQEKKKKAEEGKWSGVKAPPAPNVCSHKSSVLQLHVTAETDNQPPESATAA